MKIMFDIVLQQNVHSVSDETLSCGAGTNWQSVPTHCVTNRWRGKSPILEQSSLFGVKIVYLQPQGDIHLNLNKI